METPALILAGTHSGVGKTTLTMGILQVLSRNMKVQSFKVGPDYIDPAFHSFITGRYCRNLDSWMLSEDTLRYLFLKNATGADFSVVEGVMGLYDGKGAGGGQGSTAHLARILNLPVVLVVDGSGMAASAAALVLGYQQYDPRILLKGVIFNNIKTEKHYRLLQEAVERDTGVKVLGYLPREDFIQLPSRHLGLVPSSEIRGLRELLERLGDTLRRTVDLEALTALAQDYTQGFNRPALILPLPREEVNLAVARDSAFNFYYQDSLELLEYLGAQLIYYSPLEDSSLPASLDGMLLGGGFPEVFAPQLEANRSLREELRSAVDEGIPVYGECGGLMYLSQGITDGEERLRHMVGAFQGRIRMADKLQRFGYVEVELQEDNILGRKGSSYRAHEFHYSVLEECAQNSYSLLVRKNGGREKPQSWSCGITKGSLLASYPHLHFYSNPALADHFLEQCRRYKQRRRGKK